MAKKIESSKSKDRLLTEAKFLEAAEVVFSKEGFKGATTRLIAKKACCNLALINRYFEGKYGLLLSLIEKKAAVVRSREFVYSPQETLADELSSFGDFYLSNIMNNFNLFKIITGQFFSDQKFLKKFRDKLPLLEGNQIVEERLDKFIRDGFIAKKYTSKQIIADIETYALGLVITQLLIKGDDPKVVMLDFKKFIAQYSISLAPNE